MAAGTGALALGLLGVYFWTGTPAAPGVEALGLAVGDCDIAITSPARSRDGIVHLRAGQSLTVPLTGTATRCPNTTLTRRFDDGGSGAISVGAAGTWTASAAVADGVTTTITISSLDGGTTPLVVDALTSAPRIQVNAPTRDDWDTWRLVAAQHDAGCGGGGNINVERWARAGFVSDVDCADGGQFKPSVTLTGAAGGWLSLTWNGEALVDAGVSGSPTTLTEAQLGVLTLPDLESGELAFIARTAGGVETSLITYADVRTLSPPALVGPDGGAPELTLRNYRRAAVEVGYVLPHVPVAIGVANTEFVWTTAGTGCGGGKATTRSTCYSLEDGDAGFFIAAFNTTSQGGHVVCGAVQVPDGGCAYGSELICVRPDGGFADVADYPLPPDCRLGVAAVRRTVCVPTPAAPGGTYPVITDPIDPVGSCVSPVPRPPANAYTMTDGGGSTRAYWDAYYDESGVARALRTRPLFDSATSVVPFSAYVPGGYLAARVETQDCSLYDAEVTPQEWRCSDGTTSYEGEVRRGVVELPPINSYFIVPVLSW